MIRERHRAPVIRRAFTTIELMVTLIILVLLVGLVALVGPGVYYQQRIASTRSTMSNVLIATEQFSAENPLGQFYNRRGKETFGTLPPYQLAGAYAAQNIREKYFEPALLQPPLANGNPPSSNNQYTLQGRFERDLRGADDSGAAGDWVKIDSQADPDRASRYLNTDDIVSLYTYIRTYTPDKLRGVPDRLTQPAIGLANGASTSRSRLQFVNPLGPRSTAQPGTADSKWIAALGFVDAWGVPMDYVIYSRMEYGVDSAGNATYRIVDRKAVLRSLGVDREKYEAAVNLLNSSATGPGAEQAKLLIGQANSWIWSEDMPRPWFGGQGPTGGSQQPVPGRGAINYAEGASFGQVNANLNNYRGMVDGWVRMVGLGENYKFRPDQD